MKTQISLCIRTVWSESLLIACAFYSLLAIQRGINKNPCHTGWMYWLIWVLAGHIGLIGLVVHWLICVCTCIIAPDKISIQINVFLISLWKRAYSSTMKISLPKTESKGDLTCTHNLCFWAEIRKIIIFIYPCKPQFYYIKWGLRGSKLYRYVFVMIHGNTCDVFLMSTHNICFCGHNSKKKNISIFGWKGILRYLSDTHYYYNYLIYS